MERIILEVDDSLAKAWRNSSKSLKESYQTKITDLLRELREKEFEELLKRTSEIAKNNGLTEEILNQLLNEKD
jgi:hypothetical protein